MEANFPPFDKATSSLEGAPADLSGLIARVVAMRDHFGRPFVVADKRAGAIYIVSPEGQILEDSPALYGKHQGDEAVAGQTPAGVFVLQRHFTDEVGYGGDVMFFWSENGDDYALHRTYTRNPHERREHRLTTLSALDNRISNGCINVPAAFYDRAIVPLHGARLFVLPEFSAVFTAEHRGLSLNQNGGNVARFYDREENQAEIAFQPPIDPNRSRSLKASGKDRSRYW